YRIHYYHHHCRWPAKSSFHWSTPDSLRTDAQPRRLYARLRRRQVIPHERTRLPHTGNRSWDAKWRTRFRTGKRNGQDCYRWASRRCIRSSDEHHRINPGQLLGKKAVERGIKNIHFPLKPLNRILTDKFFPNEIQTIKLGHHRM